LEKSTDASEENVAFFSVEEQTKQETSMKQVATFFLIGIVRGGGSHLSPLGTAATNMPIVPDPGDYNDGEFGGMIGRGAEVLGENLPQCRFVHHKPHMLSGREPGPLRWEASD
jgi:hypothetical protein